MPRSAEPGVATAILIDGGTTNTRAWLVSEGRTWVAETVMIGVRDAARDGGQTRFAAGVRELLERVRRRAREAGAPEPGCVVAAGMITSGLGLAEVPHVAAPAGIRDLVGGAIWIEAPEVTDLPILLVPGVRTGPLRAEPESIGAADVMRGEETLCAGLLATGLLAPAGVLYNLGSHWKLVTTDDEGRIAGSRTSMTGELVHATQNETILAAAVPPRRPEAIDARWFAAGMSEAEGSGLARALFCVRLLHQRCDGSEEQRLSFLLGAYAAADLDPLVRSRVFRSGIPLVISGRDPLATAVRDVLQARSLDARVLSPSQIEEGMIAGLSRIAAAAMPGSRRLPADPDGQL
jgi:2-dehydro-3-deoxygalactonokinase